MQSVSKTWISTPTLQLPDLGDEGREAHRHESGNNARLRLGCGEKVFNTGANDVIHVKANVGDAFGQNERLLPFVFDEVVQEVDKEAKVIKVDWDPGF